MYIRVQRRTIAHGSDQAKNSAKKNIVNIFLYMGNNKQLERLIILTNILRITYNSNCSVYLTISHSFKNFLLIHLSIFLFMIKENYMLIMTYF